MAATLAEPGPGAPGDGGSAARSKTFEHSGSQAVRNPKAFRLPEGEVTVRRHGRGGLIEPARKDLSELWAALDQLVSDDFMADGRQQPPMPPPKALFDD